MGIVAGSIAGLEVYWYGLLISIALVLGYLITAINLYRRKRSLAHLTEIFIIGIISGILAARIGYIALYLSSYSGQWNEILMLPHGGLSAVWSFCGILVAVGFYVQRHGLNLWLWLDILTPALLLVCIMAQFGNFMLQATVGMPVVDSQAVNVKIIQYIEYSFRPIGFESYGYFKPVALYQALWQAGIFCFTVYASYTSIRYRWRQGSIFLVVVILVCMGRFFLGMIYLGAGDGIQLSQIFCGIVTAAAAWRLFFGVNKKRAKRVHTEA